MNLKIKDIVKCINGVLITGNENDECENFSKDSREIQEGDTYIAIKGKNFDGNLFWKEALDKGAETVIIETKEISQEDIKKYNGKNIIQVENTIEAIQKIAIEKRKLYEDLTVIGVTGSVGKTTTKDIIANVLSQKYKTLKTEGNNNNSIGVPFTILKLRDHDIAVIEMGMNHLGEISELSKIAKPTVSVITNIGTSHIGNLGSRENILKAKLEILDGMDIKKLIINNDNDLLHDLKENFEVHTFGIKNKSECIATNIRERENETEFVCCVNGEKIEIKVPVGGEAFVLNSLCAILIGKMMNLSNEDIQKGISSFTLSKKRMEIINLKNNVKIINDSYNASFDSMKVAIEYLRNTKGKRKIAVLGDMFELGTYTEELHRKVGEEFAKNKIDFLYTIGDNSILIEEEAVKNGVDAGKVRHFSSRKELIENIAIESGDVILFKASNGMKLFEIVEEIKNKIGAE